MALDYVSCYIQVRVWSTNMKRVTLDNCWKISIGKSSKLELVQSLHVYAGWQIDTYR